MPEAEAIPRRAHASSEKAFSVGEGAFAGLRDPFRARGNPFKCQRAFLCLRRPLPNPRGLLPGLSEHFLDPRRSLLSWERGCFGC